MSAAANLMVRLPQTVSESVRKEIAAFVAHVPADASCLVTGSLIEGLGNLHSDVDFYIVQPDGAAARPTSIGIRRSRYVDCEYLLLPSVRQLAECFDDPSAEAMLGLRQQQFDRYYRLAIGVPLSLTPEVADVLQRFSRDRACTRFAGWSAVRAYHHFARATVSYALGQQRQAQVLLGEAARWRATRVLAESGEGYPSLKWAEVKAERRFGSASPAYDHCLEGCRGSSGDLAADLARMRDLLPPPATAMGVIRKDRWLVGKRVAVVTEGDDKYLVRGHRSIVRTSGVTGAIVARLAAGMSWPEVVAAMATDLSVPADEVVAASFEQLRDLRSGGFLVEPTGQETLP